MQRVVRTIPYFCNVSLHGADVKKLADIIILRLADEAAVQ